jgi:hypothetical protein
MHKQLGCVVTYFTYFGLAFMSRHEKLGGQDGWRCGVRILLSMGKRRPERKSIPNEQEDP